MARRRQAGERSRRGCPLVKQSLPPSIKSCGSPITVRGKTEPAAGARDYRGELNAMTSRQLVDFVEGKLEFYGVAKVIPGGEVIHQHARHHLENKLTGELIA